MAALLSRIVIPALPTLSFCISVRTLCERADSGPDVGAMQVKNVNVLRQDGPPCMAASYDPESNVTKALFYSCGWGEKETDCGSTSV